MNNEPQILSRQKVVDILNGYKVKATEQARMALQQAIEAATACYNCAGTGKLSQPSRPNGPHQKKVSVRGQVVYFTDCLSCKGTGQLLDVVCVSCGVKEPLPVKTKSFVHCRTCNEKFTRLGLIY